MANINQVISLGIGSPASIGYFIRFGLGPSVFGVIRVTLPDRIMSLALDKRDAAALVLPDRTIATETENRP